MKTNLMKISLVLAIGLLCTNAEAQNNKAKTQTKKSVTVSSNGNRYDNFYSAHTTDGKSIDHMKSYWNDTSYDATFENDKLTKLLIDGKEIPSSEWGNYTKVIEDLRAQIQRDREQAKRDQEQAVRDQQQAKRDQEQAQRDQQQAKRDQEQAQREQVQAKKDQEQAQRDQQQAKRDQEQAQRDQQQAKRDQEQAQHDQVQAGKDQEQAKRDQEQALRDQEQAKRDQEQARKDQLLMKQMLGDLVADKIVPSEDSVREITLNDDEMTVNGKKQPEEIFKKYRDKYVRFSNLNFSYGTSDGVHTYRGLHVNKRSN